MKYITNRLLNAILLSFMATFAWFILGICVGGFIFALKFGITMFLILLLIFSIMFFTIKDMDFFKKPLT